MVHFGQGMLPWQPILWRETATSWRSPLLFLRAFYNVWEERKLYTHTETPDESSTSCKNFANFSAPICYCVLAYPVSHRIS